MWRQNRNKLKLQLKPHKKGREPFVYANYVQSEHITSKGYTIPVGLCFESTIHTTSLDPFSSFRMTLDDFELRWTAGEPSSPVNREPRRLAKTSTVSCSVFCCLPRSKSLKSSNATEPINFPSEDFVAIHSTLLLWSRRKASTTASFKLGPDTKHRRHQGVCLVVSLFYLCWNGNGMWGFAMWQVHTCSSTSGTERLQHLGNISLTISGKAWSISGTNFLAKLERSELRVINPSSSPL